jgi:limonene-1,2-epoxide hydrolase
MSGGEQSGMRRRAFLATAGLGTTALALAMTAEAADWSDAERTNVKVVNDFCAAWKTGDPAKVASYFADGCMARPTAHDLKHPSPGAEGPIVGRPALLEAVKKFMDGSKIDLEVVDVFVQGPLVVNTRIDHLTGQNGSRQVYYAGVFYVKDGRIQEWSDYEVHR